MIKGFKQIAFLTTISRILGMLRDMAFSHFFGAGWLMTAWTMGFKVPNLARRLFGEGAASASFIPIYSQQLQNDPKTATQLASTVVTVIFVILAAITIIGQAIIWGFFLIKNPNFGTKTGLILCSIMLPYMIAICIVAILAGILNTHRHFAAPAAAPIILNIFIIAAMLITGWVFKIKPQQQVFLVAAAVLIAGIAQIAIQIPPLRANGIRIRPAWQIYSEPFKRIIIMMGPMILGLTVTQLNTLADDLIALSFMREGGYPLTYGAPSYLYYAQRLYQFPLGVLGISLATAIFPVMSADAAKKDFNALSKTIARGIRATVFVALPATVGLIIVAKPLVAAVFEHGKFTAKDTPIVAWTLSFYAIGLCGFFCQQIVTRAFYSMQDSKMPMKSAVIAVIVNIILNLTLIWFMGTAGLALSTAICSYLQVTILIFVLRKRLGKSILDKLPLTAVKSIIATAVMYIASMIVLMITRFLPADTPLINVIRLAVVVPAAAGTYFLAAKLLKIEMLKLIKRR